MSESSSKGKLVLIVMLWVFLAGIAAVTWKVFIQPSRDKAAAEEVAKKEKEKIEIITETGTPSRYKHEINLPVDGFSGYAVLRSEAFRKELAKKSIRVKLPDDNADYSDRIKKLKSGEAQMAVFTIDALLKMSAELNEMPATIVAIIDESRGADAVVAVKSKYENANDFNDPNLNFVLTMDSPSETLARVMMAEFNLPDLSSNPFLPADGPEDVFKQAISASANEDHAYVLWEPFLSRALSQNKSLHTIYSSKPLVGGIVDVLVVNREFLRANHDLVKDVLKCYFTAAYQYRNDMTSLLQGDDKTLNAKQAQNLVDGVKWKYTQHNYAHFGIQNGDSVRHIQEMIEYITRVLSATSDSFSDPTNGRPNDLFFAKILQELADENFHPAGSASNGDDLEDNLRALTDVEWESKLVPVGDLNVVFKPSSSTLGARSRRTLNDLADTLRAQRYYVRIRGIATRKGNDLELNKKYAADRAQVAFEFLKEAGIREERMRTAPASLGDSSAVMFTLGQLPY